MSIRVTRVSGPAAAPMRPGSAVPRMQSRLSRPVGRGGKLVVRAEDKPESAPALEGGSGAGDFDDKLAKLQMKKARTGAKTPSKSKAKKSKYDFTGETVVMEEGPHKGDLAVNVALGISIVWLPLTIAAAGRAAFVKYRFTDKRVSVITKAPWKEEQLDAAYAEVQDVVGVGRGVGAWGDLLITLRNGDKVEMRSVPRWQEMKTYVLQQRDALAAAVESEVTTGTPLASDRGFAS